MLPFANWVMLVASALVLGAQPEVSSLPEGLLTRPVTPASVALLVLDARSAEVQQRLGEALRDARPAVRAMAARVVTVTGSSGQASILRDVLSRESDALAAREEVRALLALELPERETAIAEAIARIGGESALVLAEVSARRQGSEVLRALPMLLERSRDAASLADILSVVARERPDERQQLAEGVVLVGDGALWRAYLAALDRHHLAVSTAVWLAGLRAPAPAVQSETLFALAMQLESKEKVAPAVLAAALPADPWPPPAPVEADYGRELVARAHGRRPSRADWAPIVAGLGGRLPWALWSRMTDAEREAAQAAGFGRGGKGTGAGYQAPMRQTADAAGRPARIMRPIVADVLTEMAAITGCRLGSDADYAAALLTYRPDGRPKQVSLVKRSIPRRCTAFVSAAMTLLVARADHALVEAPTDVVFLPLQSEMLGCIDHVPLTRPLDMGETGVSMPELLREAKPKYTPDAMKSRVEGTVLLRAVVSDTGCVSHAEVLRPLHPELDLEALSAILQWKFKPARRDDRPVAVQVSVEVAFNLRR